MTIDLGTICVTTASALAAAGLTLLYIKMRRRRAGQYGRPGAAAPCDGSDDIAATAHEIRTHAAIAATHVEELLRRPGDLPGRTTASLAAIEGSVRRLGQLADLLPGPAAGDVGRSGTPDESITADIPAVTTPLTILHSVAGSVANRTDEKFLASFGAIIERNISNVDFTIEQLAEQMCISSSGLFAKIKGLTGMTPNKLLLLVRLQRSAALIGTREYRVNEVAYMVGFNNPSYFAKCFQRQFGVLPKDFTTPI